VDEANEISLALAESNSITHVKFYLQFKDADCDSDAMHRVGTALNGMMLRNQRIQSIHIHAQMNVLCWDALVTALRSSLVSHSSLRTFKITAGGGLSLAMPVVTEICSNKNLTTIALEGYSPGSSARDLFDALKKNPNLTSLSISDELPLDPLIGLLRNNSSIRKFHLFPERLYYEKETAMQYYQQFVGVLGTMGKLTHVGFAVVPETFPLLDMLTKCKHLISASIKAHPKDANDCELMRRVLELACKPLQQVRKLVWRNRCARNERIIDMVVVMKNVMRSKQALNMLPKEMWRKIFGHLSYFGIFTLEKIAHSVMQ
jgi:hypothetical protein